MAKVYRFHEVVTVPRSPEEVFTYLRQPNNLKQIMPPELRLRIEWPEDRLLSAGDEFWTRMRKNGVPVSWRTRVTHMEPGVSFSDVQLSGPFRRWEHNHTVKPVAGGTEVHDEIEIELPLGVLGQLAMWLFLRSDLERTFAHRKREFLRAFGG
jgi:ligand-binding SRPBCC domain-containing protein